MSFYTELLHLMGNVMAWVLFLNSHEGRRFLPQGQSSLINYIFIVGVSFASATASFYAIIGSINFIRLKILQKHYKSYEKDQPGFTRCLVNMEFFYVIICVTIVLSWLGLFAALSTILLNSEVTYWTSCCLGAVILSYIAIDSALMIFFKIFKPRKMLIMLIMRGINSEYLTISVVSETEGSSEPCKTTKPIETTTGP